MEEGKYPVPIVVALAFLYILVSIVSVETSMYYLFYEFLLLTLALYLFFMRGGIYKELPVGFYVISLLVILVSCSALLLHPNFLAYNIHYILYYLMCLSLYAFLRSGVMSVDSVLKSINIFYIVYLSASLVMWFFDIKLGGYELSEKHTLEIFNIGKSILLGVNGSPASLDSFSALVFVLNLFFSDSNKRKFILIMALIAILLSLRLTPLVAIAVSIMTYIIARNVVIWFNISIVVNLVFLASIYLSWVIMEDIDTIQNSDYSYLYKVTHARFVIWGQQVGVMLDSYSFTDYVLGGFENELYNITLYQVDGTELNRKTFNPHSSILLLFFRNPFLFVLMYLVYVYLTIKYFDRRRAAVAVFIFLSLTMNSSLLATGNPVFTIAMILLALPSRKYEVDNAGIRKCNVSF